MSKVGPEIEELMWSLAENRDPSAIDEFGQRFPDLRRELGKRLALTECLRGASPGRSAQIPRFKPRPAPLPTVWTRPAGLAFAAVLLGALAFGSYYVANRVTESRSAARHEAVDPGRVGEPIESAPSGFASPKVPPDSPDRSIQPTPGPASGNPAVQELPRYLRPQTLAIKSGKFMSVILLLGEYCGLQIEMPDLPADMAEMTIEANYTDMTPIAMLSDLGARYGFTPYSQGGNKVLLIPARPGGTLNAETSGEHVP